MAIPPSISPSMTIVPSPVQELMDTRRQLSRALQQAAESLVAVERAQGEALAAQHEAGASRGQLARATQREAVLQARVGACKARAAEGEESAAMLQQAAHPPG